MHQPERTRRSGPILDIDSVLVFCLRSRMPEPPYDRPLALASLVRTMRHHYVAVRCGCGAERVIAIARMADDSRLADYTLAHVAMTLRCEGCHDGPDEVHLAATVHGMRPASGGGDVVWTMPLVTRDGRGAKRRRAPTG